MENPTLQMALHHEWIPSIQHLNLHLHAGQSQNEKSIGEHTQALLREAERQDVHVMICRSIQNRIEVNRFSVEEHKLVKDREFSEVE